MKIKVKDFLPLVVLYGFKNEDNLVFIGRKGEISLFGHSDDILNILKYCNGRNNLKEIREKNSKINDDIFYELVEILEKQEIICDSRSIYRIFHEDSINPMLFSYDWSQKDILNIEYLFKRSKTQFKDGDICIGDNINFESNLLNIFDKRCSIRHFKNDSFAKNKFFALVKSLCGCGKHKNIPSAGGLYPLEFYIVVLEDIEDIKRGYYCYYSERDILRPLKVDSGIERVYQILDSISVLENAKLVIFFGADLSRTTLKYSNRGYRYILAEVGHSAQNVNLFCVENGLGAVEWGGFNDQKVAKTLKLNYPDHTILLSMVVGIPDLSVSQEYSDFYFVESNKLTELLVGKDKPVEWMHLSELTYKRYTMPLFSATAKYLPVNSGKSKKTFSFATGRTTKEVKLKVLAEAFERYSSSVIRIDKILEAQKIEDEYLDPRIITPYNDEQIEMLGYSSFAVDKEWQWVLGHYLKSNKNVYVTVDNVFYPLPKKIVDRNLCCASNSSGVAAHSDFGKAIENGFLELIERDAIVTTWYSKRNVSLIPIDFASRSVRERINFWSKEGRKVSLVNMTIDSIPVVVVFMVSNGKYLCVVSGAAASFTYEEAISKAFTEAEYMLLSWRKTRKSLIRDLKKVISPREHGILYFHSENKHHLEQIINAVELKPKKNKISYNDLVASFDPVVVDITPRGINCGLSVVRVLSEKLMPINFGYRTEYIGHSRMNMLNLKWKRSFPSQPHFFA